MKRLMNRLIPAKKDPGVFSPASYAINPVSYANKKEKYQQEAAHSGTLKYLEAFVTDLVTVSRLTDTHIAAGYDGAKDWPSEYYKDSFDIAVGHVAMLLAAHPAQPDLLSGRMRQYAEQAGTPVPNYDVRKHELTPISPATTEQEYTYSTIARVVNEARERTYGPGTPP